MCELSDNFKFYLVDDIGDNKDHKGNTDKKKNVNRKYNHNDVRNIFTTAVSNDNDIDIEQRNKSDQNIDTNSTDISTISDDNAFSAYNNYFKNKIINNEIKNNETNGNCAVINVDKNEDNEDKNNEINKILSSVKEQIESDEDNGGIIDFLKSCLHLNPSERKKIKDLLNMPIFSEIDLPKNQRNSTRFSSSFSVYENSPLTLQVKYLKLSYLFASSIHFFLNFYFFQHINQLLFFHIHYHLVRQYVFAWMGIN